MTDDWRTEWGTLTDVVPTLPSECVDDPTHRGFVTDGTGMLLCAVCGALAETDYDAPQPTASTTPQT